MSNETAEEMVNSFLNKYFRKYPVLEKLPLNFEAIKKSVTISLKRADKVISKKVRTSNTDKIRQLRERIILSQIDCFLEIALKEFKKRKKRESDNFRALCWCA